MVWAAIYAWNVWYDAARSSDSFCKVLLHAYAKPWWCWSTRSSLAMLWPSRIVARMYHTCTIRSRVYICHEAPERRRSIFFFHVYVIMFGSTRTANYLHSLMYDAMHVSYDACCWHLPQVRAMIVTCPQLLLSDVRNVVVPSLQYMLRTTSHHDELGKRLFRDPSLLVVGVGPLARLQYTLEQYRNGTASIAMGNLGAAVGPETALPAAYGATPWVGGGGGSGKASSSRSKRRRAPSPKDASCTAALPLEEDQSRLLPPVIVPQVCQVEVKIVTAHSCSCSC